MKKILIVNPFGIGDVIFSTPLIEAIRHNYPDSFLGYICNKRAYEIISSNPRLNKVYIYEKDDFRALWQRSRLECVKKIFAFLKIIKKEKFDILIDLSLGYQFSLILSLIGIRQRLGFNYRDRGRFLTKKIDIDGFVDMHVVEYYLDILRLMDIDPSGYRARPKVYLSESDAIWASNFLDENGVKEKDILIGVIPGCGASWGPDAKRRRWRRGDFARVCEGLIKEHGAKVVLFGDSKEVEICEDIQKMVPHELIMACGRTNIANFLGLLNKCALVITNDGGPLHMAVSVGRKTVSIFGPVDEKIYGPYPLSPDHIVISKRDLPCRPCYKKFKYHLCENRYCLSNITPEEVLKAADTLLSRMVK